jgi:hypothetical protein
MLSADEAKALKERTVQALSTSLAGVASSIQQVALVLGITDVATIQPFPTSSLDVDDWKSEVIRKKDWDGSTQVPWNDAQKLMLDALAAARSGLEAYRTAETGGLNSKTRSCSMGLEDAVGRFGQQVPEIDFGPIDAAELLDSLGKLHSALHEAHRDVQTDF